MTPAQALADRLHAVSIVWSDGLGHLSRPDAEAVARAALAFALEQMPTPDELAAMAQKAFDDSLGGKPGDRFVEESVLRDLRARLGAA